MKRIYKNFPYSSDCFENREVLYNYQHKDQDIATEATVTKAIVTQDIVTEAIVTEAIVTEAIVTQTVVIQTIVTEGSCGC